MSGIFPASPKELNAVALRAWTVRVLDALLAATAAGACPVQLVPPPAEAPPPEWRHLHALPELFIQCGGTTRFSFPGSMRGFDLHAGQVFIMPRLLAHRETVLGGAAFSNLVFMPNDGLVAYHLAGRSPEDLSQPYGTISDAIFSPDGRLAMAAMDGIVRCACSPIGKEREVAGWFTAWASLMRGLIAAAPVTETAVDHVARCQVFVETSLSNSDLSVEQLARWCQCSADHLGRIFRAETGETLVAYIARMRMARACILLAGSVLPVRTVANAVGYPDPSYFSRSFRRVLGASPEEWRRSGSAVVAPWERPGSAELGQGIP
jgi:AraC-like DNA-binding protein